MNNPLNPYAPPTVDELEAEQRDFPWYVAVRGIHVQDGAVLPEVDLLTGEEGAHLLPVAHTVNLTKGKTPRYLSVILFVVVGVIVGIDLPLHWSIACAAGTVGLISLFFRKSYPRVTFTISSGTAQPTANRKIFFRVAEIAFFVAAIGSMALLQFTPWAFISFFVFGFLSQRMSKRREGLTIHGLEIREASGVTGWVRIGGAHPAALAMLNEIQRHRAPLASEFPGS